MNYEKLEQQAENYFKKWLGPMWDQYDDYAKTKLKVGYIQGYTQAEIDQFNKKWNIYEAAQ